VVFFYENTQFGFTSGNFHFYFNCVSFFVQIAMRSPPRRRRRVRSECVTQQHDVVASVAAVVATPVAERPKLTAKEVGEIIKQLVDESQREGKFVIPLSEQENKLARTLDDPVRFVRYRQTLQDW